MEEERIDWTRGCVNAATYVTDKGARKLCACTAMRKGCGKCKGEITGRVSSPREEDRARNLDKADKDGDDGTGRKGERGRGTGGGERERAECGRRSERRGEQGVR